MSIQATEESNRTPSTCLINKELGSDSKLSHVTKSNQWSGSVLRSESNILDTIEPNVIYNGTHSRWARNKYAREKMPTVLRNVNIVGDFVLNSHYPLQNEGGRQRI